MYRFQHICDVDTHAHTCTHPSVRPSVRLASVLAARLGFSHIRAVTCAYTCVYVRYMHPTCIQHIRYTSMHIVESESLYRLHKETKKKHGWIFSFRAHYALRTLTMYIRARPSVRPSCLLVHPSLGMFTVCEEALAIICTEVVQDSNGTCFPVFYRGAEFHILWKQMPLVGF